MIPVVVMEKRGAIVKTSGKKRKKKKVTDLAFFSLLVYKGFFLRLTTVRY